MEICLTVGDWQVTRFTNISPSYLLEHYCRIKEEPRQRWHAYSTQEPIICNWCEQSPPEGLIAVLLFLRAGE